MRYLSAVKPCLILILCLYCPKSAFGLTSGEESALASLLRNFPVLGGFTPPRWSNVSIACNDPVFNGLTCSDGPDPHVLAMYGGVQKHGPFGSFLALY